MVGILKHMYWDSYFIGLYQKIWLIISMLKNVKLAWLILTTLNLAMIRRSLVVRIR